MSQSTFTQYWWVEHIISISIYLTLSGIVMVGGCNRSLEGRVTMERGS